MKGQHAFSKIIFVNQECILSTAIDITGKKETDAILHSQIEELDQTNDLSAFCACNSRLSTVPLSLISSMI